MKQTTNDNIFKTYHPKGLACSRFTDERYELATDLPVPNLESGPAPLVDTTTIRANEQCHYTQEFITNKRREVLLLAEDYLNALGINEYLQDEIAKTFDFLFPLFPRRYNIHESAHLAEIIVFHILKEKSISFDPDDFRNASPVGNMPMCHRPWLLQYKQYLPVPKNYRHNQSPDKYLVQLYESTFISEEFRKKCEEIKPIILRLSGNVHPKHIAGMICFIASKAIPLSSTTMNEALGIIGIKYPGTIHNAVKRLKNRWNSIWNVFFKKGNKCMP